MRADVDSMLMHLDEDALDDALARYARDGYAVLGNVVPEAVLAPLRARVDAIMLGEIRHEGLFFQHDSPTGRYEDAPIGVGWQGPSLAYRKLEKLEKDPLFEGYLNDPLFERVARRRILGDVVLYRAIIMNKGAQGGSNLPWHQDGGSFWGLDRDPELQVWTALDDAPVEAGCLEFVPGTHRAGLATPLGGVIAEENVGDAQGVLVPARAGDVVLIHNHVWHRSGPNVTGRPRRAFSVCYMDASIRCRRKKRAPRTFVPVFAAKRATTS